MTKQMKSNQIIPAEVVEKRILLIRGQKIMLSVHLADLYGVQTRVLNQAVNRNIRRFPHDFMFQLNSNEAEWLVSQNVIPHRKHYGGSLPYAFTEQGIAMLSSVLRSERAIQVNVAVMRTFVKLREILSTRKDLARKLDELEKKYDKQFAIVRKAIRELMEPPKEPKREIGFRVKEPIAHYATRKR